MSRYRSKSSSSEDGEVSGNESDGQQVEPVPVKVTNTKLWSNVMLDQTADEVVSGVNAFAGNSGNRSVESYQGGRKRKRSETSDNLFDSSKNSQTPSEVLSSSNPSAMSMDQSSASKRRKCIVYDMLTNNSDGEDNYDKVDAVTEKSKTEPVIPHELDVTFEDVIMESSAFLQRVKQRQNRPAKDAPKEEYFHYLQWVLNEKNTELLERLLEIKSTGFAMYVLDKTIQKEKDGGILTNSGIRRRLPGGVFISHLKSHLSPFERFVVLDGKSQSEAQSLCERKCNKKNRKRAAKQRKKQQQQAQNGEKTLDDVETLQGKAELATDAIVNDVLEFDSDSGEKIDAKLEDDAPKFEPKSPQMELVPVEEKPEIVEECKAEIAEDFEIAEPLK